MNLWRNNSVHPGVAEPGGPLRVAAGVIRLRPVRMRDAAQWSRIRLADRSLLEPWEPTAEVDWGVRHAVSSWLAVCSGLRSEARRGRMLPYVIEVDGQFRGQLTIGERHPRRAALGVDRLLGRQRCDRGRRGDRRAGPRPDHCFGPVTLHRGGGHRPAGERRQPRGVGQGRIPRGGLLRRYLDVDGRGGTTCWWR